MPVYNALEDVQHCIASILANKASYSLNLILVNDASNDETSHFLRAVDASEPNITLLENDQNQGYARSANKGLEVSTASYVILLNSDIIVSKHWTEKLIACAESNPRIGIVSPVTNSAIWQSVPFIPDTHQSTRNLPGEEEVNRFSKLVEKCSYAIYPQLPYIHGFCQFIKRELIESIGFVDEKNFPNGLGSEQDYCYRATDAGYLSVVADDTFIYHSKAKSLGRKLRAATDWEKRLDNKHGENRHKNNKPKVLNCPEMNALRMATTFELYRLQLRNDLELFNYNIAFLIPSQAGLENMEDFFLMIKDMVNRHITVKIFVEETLIDSVINKYQPVLAAKKLVLGYHHETVLATFLQDYDVVICADTKSLSRLQNMKTTQPEILAVYYVNPSFSPQNERSWEKIDAAYLKSTLLITLSDALARAFIQAHGVHVHNIHHTDEEDNRATCPGDKIRSFFSRFSSNPATKETNRLLRLLKDAILYHRRNQPPVAFGKGVPSTGKRGL